MKRDRDDEVRVEGAIAGAILLFIAFCVVHTLVEIVVSAARGIAS